MDRDWALRRARHREGHGVASAAGGGLQEADGVAVGEARLHALAVIDEHAVHGHRSDAGELLEAIGRVTESFPGEAHRLRHRGGAVYFHLGDLDLYPNSLNATHTKA